jgi:hypothetical protein
MFAIHKGKALLGYDYAWIASCSLVANLLTAGNKALLYRELSIPGWQRIEASRGLHEAK